LSTRIRSPSFFAGATGWVVGSTTQVAFLLGMCVSWPSFENGAEMMRWDTPLLAIDATS
jgi:hypothetical protein